MEAKIFLGVFASIFFTSTAFCYSPGQTVIAIDQNQIQTRTGLNGQAYSKPVSYIIAPQGYMSHYPTALEYATKSLTEDRYIPSHTIYVCHYNSYLNKYDWVGKGYSGFYAWPDFVSQLSDSTIIQPSETPTNLNMVCAEPPQDQCDLDDDDQDGICNQCDQLPGVPDQDDCLRGTSTNAAGETTSAFIDKGCQGQTGEWWTADNYSSEDKFVANIGDTSASKGKLNCNANCTTDDPCSYGQTGIGAYVAGMQSSAAAPDQTAQEIIDSLLDLPSPDDMPDRCDGHNQQCKEYCEDKLGVGMSYCYEKNGEKKSNCRCNNNFAYDMVTDSDTPAMEQADINKDSNNSGVPDYADDSILNQGDADNDGITDKADVDHTGGQDSNGDGIDDAYTANAQASANASAGLSKSDSLNLDSIATSTAQTSAAAQGLKAGIDQISDNTADLIARADASIALSEDLRAKLNSFSEEGTASLATQEGQLVDGLFPGIQPGDIPDDPTKNFDVDAFVQEFSFAFPDEVKTIIEGSSLEVQNPDSCVTGEIMGQQVQFCFDRFQAVFLAMGLLFKGLCVWRAIEIIAVGVRA